MPSDSLFLEKLAAELHQTLLGGRIDKITMPEKDTVILFIRAQRLTHQLLICAAPISPRIHFTDNLFENPAVAPSFLMHLRKHIGGAIITKIESIPFERIIKIHLVCKNELGLENKKTIIAEIMGKYSNVMLLSEDEKISECMRHIGFDTSSKRQVLPGMKYVLPPSQDKLTPKDITQIKEKLSLFTGGRLDNFILSILSGLAPLTIKEIVFNALNTLEFSEGLNEEQICRLINEISKFYYKSVKPCILYCDNTPKDFFIFPFTTVSGNYKSFETLNLALNEFYAESSKDKSNTDKTKHLLTLIKNAISRTEKKLSDFKNKEISCKNLDDDKLMGELLTANLYKIKQGMSAIILENYYDDCKQITVELDKMLSPQQNAQLYYKRYSKKKKTLDSLKTQIENAKNELDYFYSFEANLRLAKSKDDIEELSDELFSAGLLKAKLKQSKAKYKKTKDNFIKVDIEGFKIKIGKNNIQNDLLVKNARGNDLWLHTQKIHGSHTVIENGVSAPDTVIEKAAKLCAFHSKAYQSDNVPVDYTSIKFVSKPSGSVPGKVIYTNQKTIYVTPSENI